MRIRQGPFIIALVTTLAQSSLLSAQAAGVVTGTVTDSSGTPIAQADVVLRPTRQRARTDSAGVFSIGDVANGTYSVSARKIGYAPDLYDVKLSSGGTVRVKLMLALNPLDLVTVSATRECPLYSLSGFFCRRRAGGGMFLDYPDIDDRGALYTADLFRDIPGFRVSLYSAGRSGVMPYPQRTKIGACLVYIVDGHAVDTWGGVPAYTREITAMEIYSPPDTLPSELKRITVWHDSHVRTNNCTIVAFWTTHARPTGS
jgi:hypothetical protein